MSSGVREIKSRIKSISNIQQITRAMKMIAAARIKRAEVLMKSSRPYAHKMRELVQELVSQLDEILHPLMEQRPANKVAVIVIASDKGLCGAYNHNIIRRAYDFLKKSSENLSLELILLGLKASYFFKKKDFPIIKEFPNWESTYYLAKLLASMSSHWFINKSFDEIYCFYTYSTSALVQEVKTEKVLPLKTDLERKKTLPYIFEPSHKETLDVLLDKYLEVVFYNILLEAKTSELGARLKAMTNATDNAEKYHKELTLQFYKARQEAITREILEVATGAEAFGVK